MDRKVKGLEREIPFYRMGRKGFPRFPAHSAYPAPLWGLREAEESEVSLPSRKDEAGRDPGGPGAGSRMRAGPGLSEARPRPRRSRRRQAGNPEGAGPYGPSRQGSTGHPGRGVRRGRGRGEGKRTALCHEAQGL